VEVRAKQEDGSDTAPASCHAKPKLTIDEQIAHLKSKGITFRLCSEDDVYECLMNKTYYFKIAAYRVLFPKHVGGKFNDQYVNLDFGMLKDLATIDQMLRYALLPMTLDVEHFAKVKLLRKLTEHVDEDGYQQARQAVKAIKCPHTAARNACVLISHYGKGSS
jgi:abortive infection bacteriophage resistance protein